MNLSEMKRRYEGSHLAGKHKIVSVDHELVILRRGWEMDNLGWIVTLSNGKKQALSTNHGSLCILSKQELDEYIKTTEDSLDSLVLASTLIGESNGT